MENKSEQFQNRLVFDLSESDYAAAPGIRNSELKWFREYSPRHFKAVRDGHLRVKPTAAQIEGTLVHSLVLEKRVDYVVHPEMYPCKPTKSDPRTEKPWTYQADFCKEWRDAQKAVVVSPAQAAQVKAGRDAVINHGFIGRLFTEGKSEVTGFAKCPRTGLLLKARFDYLKKREIVDLKKSVDADTHGFVRAIAKQKYVAQAAHYTYVAKLLGLDIVAFYFVAVELEPLAMANAIRISEQDMATATQSLYRTLEQVAECEAENHWPGYCDDEPNCPVLPNWAHDYEEEALDLNA